MNDLRNQAAELGANFIQYDTPTLGVLEGNHGSNTTTATVSGVAYRCDDRGSPETASDIALSASTDDSPPPKKSDKRELDFKKPTEASISYAVKGKKLNVEVKDYYSPLLMKRLELENEGRLSKKERVNVFDYRQAIEHVVIDINYGEGQKKKEDIAFNAEAFLHKNKKNDLVAVTHEHSYEKAGVYTVAVKIVDVLGEEYFETKEITVK